jgi:hypothetical protein
MSRSRNLVPRAGLVPVMALAQQAGLAGLTGEHVRIAGRCGVNPQVKVPGIVAGMIGGADSIDDLDLLRHGAMGALFGGIRAPPALGSFLRSFSWGNVLQLGTVSGLVLAELASRAVAARQGPRRHHPPGLTGVAARTARHGRSHITLHLPAGWHREHEWLTVVSADCGPPPAAA